MSTGDVELTNSENTQTIKVEKTTDADFLVGLSALSSASSLATTTSKPLDIVLVLDESGSMGDNLNSYEEVYQLNENHSYYVLVDGEYREVDYSYGGHGQREGWYYERRGNRTYVTPMTSAEDNSPDHTQFFTRTSMSKMAALKAAAKAFVKQVGMNNDAIQEASNRHQVAVVSYSDSSTINIDLTTDTNDVEESIDKLNANGATAADYGLQKARDVLNGKDARENAQKVVIFFTDGEPNHFSGFDGDVAADAINTANALKDTGATIYSIGVFNGANPSDTSGDFNKYMNAVSSNYPDAECGETGWYWNNGDLEYGWHQTDNFGDLQLGNRISGKDYYFAATDAEGLNDVFNAISEDMQQAASPTEVTNNDPHHSGYITFTDILGEYMEVKGVNAVVYAGEKHDATYDSETKKVTITNPQVDGNEIYGSANLEDIQITVTEGQNGAGDTVEVKIPASLIPLRYYDIKTENGETSMTIRGNAYPIRVFYSVGLKDDAEAQVKSGNYTDPTLQTYVNGHKDDDGNVVFYSNAYSATQNATNGSTTATFTPAETNSFYYFTEDTPLYMNEGQTRAKNIDANATYYYPIYYYNAGSNVSEQTYWVEVPGDYLANSAVIGRDDEGICIREGARRTTRAQAFELEKAVGANKTSTASNAISPSWGRGMDDSVNRVTVYLGNNGKLTVEPSSGSLKITKNVAAAEGYDLPGDVENKEFQFSITLKNSTGTALTGPYDYKIGETTGQLTLNDAGTGTFKLKKDQTIEIFGLSVGDQYTVSESSYTEDGYTTTWTGNTSGSMTDAGVSLTCTNTYQAEKTTLDGDGTTGALKVSKTIEGRDWQDDDSFTFTIRADSGNPDTAAIPSPNTVTIDKEDASDNYTDAFGDITFTKPGTYKYTITENDTDMQAFPRMRRSIRSRYR